MTLSVLQTKKEIPEVVKFLKDALAAAESGKVTGVSMVLQERDGSVFYSHAGLEDRFKILGYLSHIIFKLQSD